MNPDSKMTFSESDPRAPVSAVPAKPLQGMKILVVEDCSENQFLFRHFLSRQGAQVTLADDGVEGSNAAMTKDFDLILMDIQMPNLDGYGALKLLKAAGYLRPVVALTAHTSQEESLKIATAGFAAQLAKPVDTKILLQTLAELMGKNPIELLA